MSDKIILTEMEFIGHHGCSEEERKLEQKFRVDVEVEVDLSKAGNSDKLDDTINYVKIYEHAKYIVSEMEYNLLETIAQSIADNIMVDFNNIKTVTVKVQKAAPEEIGKFNAAVVITRVNKYAKI